MAAPGGRLQLCIKPLPCASYDVESPEISIMMEACLIECSVLAAEQPEFPSSGGGSDDLMGRPGRRLGWRRQLLPFVLVCVVAVQLGVEIAGCPIEVFASI